MKKLVITLILTSSILFVAGQKTIFPAIKDYGGMFDVPFAKDWPDTSMKYNVIIEAGMAIEKPGELYQPLEHISRLFNLLVYTGIPYKNLNVELVIFGPSIFVVLNNEAYKKKYNVDNPNLKALEEMTNAGIKIHACGQSVMLTGIDRTTINPAIDVVVSRFTTVTNRQLKGYAFYKF